ncbi:hypothetical protein LPW11_06105 [Geomonas sp. RF6]|uniref:hypothetical protein n=1 Tax=Geomonas sp. RF6 TaxID=2897342 RepID=UPI001E652583|nr:hypothetical protein [Geomonas sp. RF6]UFS71763.1 hypothetical protein LPW11_06105 [Geomonas sp. RF6]
MALVKCHECGREISDKATACIGCGCPIEVMHGELSVIDVKDEPVDAHGVESIKGEGSLSGSQTALGCLIGICVIVGMVLSFFIPHRGPLYIFIIGVVFLGSRFLMKVSGTRS